MVERVREIKVTVYVDTNKTTHQEVHEPEEFEDLPMLLRRLADEYEDRFGG